MGLFKKKLNQSSDETVFVGAHLPLYLNSFVTMFSLATGNPKSEIIINQIFKWQKDTMKGEFTLDLIIKTLIDKALEDFTDEKLKKASYGLNSFCTKLSNFLEKKGIAEIYINKIIKGVRDEA